jgi:broad specificity phosphatase PhoE
VSAIWLFRHGQAGTRADYDTLSDLGREQARLLGQWLAAQDVRFTTVLSGGLKRQRATAAAVCAGHAQAGRPFPTVEVEPGWNEFDLDGVYREIAPAIAAADPAFRAEYEQMLLDMGDHRHGIHRRWTRCDLLVLRAWMEGSVPTSCETWEAFQQRIAAALDRLVRRGLGEADNVAVFTSATPIGIACGIALEAGARTRVRLAGAQFNTAWSVLRVRDGEPGLFSFNNIPHLPDESLRTTR